WTLPAQVGVGLRFRDIRLDLFYDLGPIAPGDGSIAVPFWYGVGTSLRALLDDRVFFYIDAYALNGGAGGYTEIDYYFRRTLSGFLGFSGGAGRLFYLEPYDYWTAGGTAGID